MDRGQTYDVVDTPPKDRCNWPAFEDFQEREENSKWRDIQKGVDKVLEVQDQGYSKTGPSVVLKLEHEIGPIRFVWAPASTGWIK